MKLKMVLALFVIVFSSFAQTSESHPADIRSIKVCAISDREALVDEKLVRKTIVSVSKEYEENVGIRFEVSSFVTLPINLDVLPIDWNAAKMACFAPYEIGMIFTNKEIEINVEERGKKGELGGYSDEHVGMLVVYNVEKRLGRFDKGGNPALENILEHEIGHVFALKHTSDINSFMYSPSLHSFGKWTEETIQALNKNRNRTWR